MNIPTYSPERAYSIAQGNALCIRIRIRIQFDSIIFDPIHATFKKPVHAKHLSTNPYTTGQSKSLVILDYCGIRGLVDTHICYVVGMGTHESLGSVIPVRPF